MHYEYDDRLLVLALVYTKSYAGMQMQHNSSQQQHMQCISISFVQGDDILNRCLIEKGISWRCLFKEAHVSQQLHLESWRDIYSKIQRGVSQQLSSKTSVLHLKKDEFYLPYFRPKGYNSITIYHLNTIQSLFII